RIVGNQVFVGVSKQIDLVAGKFTKVQVSDAFQYGCQAGVLVFDRIAQAVAGGVEVGKQALDVMLGWIAVGRSLDGCKNGGQIGVQAFIGVGAGCDGAKE